MLAFDAQSCSPKPPLQRDLAAGAAGPAGGRNCCSQADVQRAVPVQPYAARCSTGLQMFHQPATKSQVKVSPGNTNQAAGRCGQADCISIKNPQLLGQNSALSSARGGKLGVGECVLAGAIKQLFSKCLMGPQESPCVTQKCCYSTITMD